MYQAISRAVAPAMIAASLLAASALATAGERTMIRARSDADYSAMRSEATAKGARIVKEMRSIGVLVVDADAWSRAALAGSTHVAGVTKDRVVRIVPEQNQHEMFGPAWSNPLLAARVTGALPAAASASVTADPVNSYPGLLWNLSRIGAPAVWPVSTGSANVRVGVADTGLDYTHSELAARVESVVDLTVNESPQICKDLLGTGFNDADWAAYYGGPADTDWNGHGSWIGGNIAASLDGVGINGIAPNVTLVALKISQWCGSAFDSEILSAFTYAADHGIDVVSISFGGYVDRTTPDGEASYQAYLSAVTYARSKGTVIVASAGNEHTRIGNGGVVLSHGTLTLPGDPLFDAYGLYETPGGIPGVVDVSATGNTVVGASATCPDGSTAGNFATCKPASDRHQPTGVGRQNQLAYYSNYGPRIDIAAPGGSRKFNVPGADRGGTAGWPFTTDDGTTAYEDFSITSNWALEIPCAYFAPPTQFYPYECYSTIQGTSMATPHVSAVLALIASTHPRLRHRPEALVRLLKDGAREVRGNTMRPLSARDTSPGDRTGVACPTGYCHLGGEAIEDEEAYGAGLVDARAALRN